MTMRFRTVKATCPTGFVITDHAVRQFIKRWHPEKEYAKAMEELVALLNTSKKDGKTGLGDTILVSGHRPEIRMVVKDRNTCVTVLPPSTSISPGETYEEEMEMLQMEVKTKDEQILAEIASMEAEVEKVNAQRASLGEKKSELCNRIDQMRRKLKWEV